MNYLAYLLLFLITSCASIDTTPPVTTRPPETQIAFTSASNLDWVKELVKVANCVANNEAFIKEVALFPDYDYTDDKSEVVALAVKNIKANVTTYKTANPFSAAIATTYPTDTVNVYLNIRPKANPRPMPDMVNTLFHEGLHLSGYKHGDNYANGKENSVNYRVGTIAAKYSPACK